MNAKRILAIFLVFHAALTCAIVVVACSRLPDDDPQTNYEVWVGENVYGCDEATLSDGRLTLSDCAGYPDPMTFVAGQDWLSVEITAHNH